MPTPHYSEQISAGGIPYIIEDGEYKVALIQMRRTHFHSWEIAKGKLEIGETPLQAAKREIKKKWVLNCTYQSHIFLGNAQSLFYLNQIYPAQEYLYLFI